MRILDKEIDFDLQDAENIDRMQKLDKDYALKFQEATTMVEQCNAYKGFFDDICGEGTSNILFGDKNNYMLIVRAYNELIDAVSKQLEEFTAETEKTKQKYERYVN